jgi:endonuclease/exonuclease/phosphatase family metal-dependent hydrolase
MEIVTWNVKRNGASVLDALARICRPDVVTLQEVRREHHDAFRQRLDTLGLPHFVYSGQDDAVKGYGNVIASRWKLRYRREEVPQPQAIAQATILIDRRPTVVITAHAPNFSKNGLEKIDILIFLAKLIREVRGKPCIVTGDFNEPRFEIQDGRIVTFGQKRNRDGRFVYRIQRKFGGRSCTGEQWDAAVRWIFENREEHGLRHAYWEVCGHCATDVSHVVSSGDPRWFDHLFVSSHFRVQRCSYLHELRAPGLSDHSALAAKLAFRAMNARGSC